MSDPQSDSPSDPTPERQTSPGALLAGRRGLVVGVANERSIAWGITRHAAAHGAQIALTFQGEALERRVRPLAERVSSPIVEPLDVTRPEEIEALFRRIGEQWGTLDFLVHSIAFADRDDLSGRTIDTSREGFLKALEISAYSLISLARAAEPLMGAGGSVLAMTYLGSVKAVPNYNVMGIAKAALEATVRYLALDLGAKGVRVNAISAGPIKTLAAAGVSGLRGMLGQAAERSPLKRNVTTDDVGTAGLYLLSDLSTAVTGEIHYVDAGFNITAW
jgi:enoyl-[acyl-carrier protein] reductase I